jgi:transcriptional regulator with XRE-family HTH domain
MPRTSRVEASVGRRIAARRNQQGLSQGTVSRRSGLDPSYLSRIENGKVHPTVRTAMRIADALRISLEDLLGPSPPSRRDRPCPVSASGNCLMDLIESGPDGPVRKEGERYSLRQVRLLRLFTHVLQEKDPAALKAFETLFHRVLNGTNGKRGKK